MSGLTIVVHYHELWLKGGNRRFFLSKLHVALKRALEGLPLQRILRPGDRLLVEFGEGASPEEAIARIERVFGIAFYAVARAVPRGGEDDLMGLKRAAWEEVRGEKFSTFAVRSKRSDKSFPYRSTDIDSAIGLLARLHELGVAVAIDDFGTGYSSLEYLKRLPVSALKIDQSFVAGLGGDSNDPSIVQAVVNLAQALRITACAEGVETDEQRRLLGQLGCPLGQGYLWSPALAPAEFSRWYRSRAPVARI